MPVAVSGGLTFRWVSLGYSHSCGVTPAGVAYCWGWHDKPMGWPFAVMTALLTNPALLVLVALAFLVSVIEAGWFGSI